MKPRTAARLGLALACLALLAQDASAEVTAPASQSRAAQARRVEHTAQRLCARQSGEARRACEQQFAAESDALRAPADGTPAAEARAAQ